MIWFFRRDAERTSYEIRVTVDELSYELIVRSPSGAETQERFTSGAQLLKRREELDEALRADGWRDENDGLCGESSRRLYSGPTARMTSEAAARMTKVRP